MRKQSDRTRTLTYRSWEAMKQRCGNQNHEAYDRYGGRGITFDPEWESYDAFVSDMGQRPSRGHTLDRIDNDKGYCKENCRWATGTVQARNRGKVSNTTSRHKNVYWSQKSSKWMARVLLEDGTRKYLGLHLTEDLAAKAIEDFYNGL